MLKVGHSMRTLIIVSHPHIEKSTTQSFFKESAAALNDVVWHPLVASEMDIAVERRILLAADRVVLEFPLYWYSAPASLWQWFDEVWVRGVVYDEQGGLLRGKSLGLVVNYGQSPQAFGLAGQNGLSVTDALKPFVGIANRTGMTLLPPILVPQFERLTEDARAELMVKYQQYLSLMHPQSREEQARWFARALRNRQQDIFADALTDQEDALLRLRQTVAELRAGEED
jgi:putative NADPH-quinone reductase